MINKEKCTNIKWKEKETWPLNMFVSHINLSKYFAEVIVPPIAAAGFLQVLHNIDIFTIFFFAK